MMTRFFSPPRLLVVEHDAGVQDLLEASLTVEGYAVALAASPAEALALLERQPFDLVLTDLFSVRLKDRFGAVEQLRTSAAPAPVGLVTGWNVKEEEVRQRGFAFLVRKPFDLEELFALIAAALEASVAARNAAPLPARVLASR